jgi:hypothetical protein
VGIVLLVVLGSVTLVFADIRETQREQILRDIWIGHDGRWFLKSASKLGFAVATQLNLAVTKSFGKTEIKRFLSEFGNLEIKNIGDCYV